MRSGWGKRGAFRRWGRMTEKEGGRKNHGPSRGGLRPINFGEGSRGEAKNLEIDSLKNIGTYIVHGKSSCVPGVCRLQCQVTWESR